MFGLRSKTTMVEPDRALPGRDTEMPVAARHAVLGTPLKPPFPEGFEQAIVGDGCFWGAERVFWQAPGVYTTAVGYAGGITPNPTYEEVCSARTGHAEAVLVVFDPAKTCYEEILQTVLGEPRPDPGHAPGQRRRHPVPLGDLLDDRGAAPDRARRPATRSPSGCARPGYGEITTEIAQAGPFYYAEDYHQQYLEKNPWGYCGLGGTGVSCPVGLGARAAPAHGRARRRAAERPDGSAAGDRGQDRDLVAVLDGRVEPVEEADVLAADVDVDEPAQAAVLGDPAAQLAEALVQRVEHLADGRARRPRGRLAVGRGPQLGWDLDA